MNYQQTIEYLYNTLPMFSRMGSAAFRKDLTNIRFLCERLGNPHLKFKSIHVGGTNGKGSVSHMLAAVFQSNGFRTGLYTSPHLYDFGERIRIDGAMAEESFVIGFVGKIKPWIEEIQPSFFEITVAMAFDYFAEKQVDIAVIEVGLGGRLDSTNIITPELSVITNIGWDHMNMLGNTLEEIAGEKAGIIKEAVPVVIGEPGEATRKVFELAAAAKKAPLHFADADIQNISYELGEGRLQASYKDAAGRQVNVSSDLSGIYQVSNIRTVLAAVALMKKNGWALRDEETLQGISQAKRLTGLSGRWEVIHRHPTVVLEVAHNSNGIAEMLRHASTLGFRKLHLVFGMVKDKDADGLLRLLPAHAAYYFTQAHIPRALEAEALRHKGAEYSLKGASYTDVNRGLEAALAAADANDLIIVCGSIFVVAEVKRTSSHA